MRARYTGWFGKLIVRVGMHSTEVGILIRSGTEAGGKARESMEVEVPSHIERAVFTRLYL